ncbi:PEGA domain-containing protein [Sorangium sp. So ce1335]|uniref:PEGA domain-containing protein n=1 Tax=Sorangium sp. So ce1335 TaxID=3133335 RepID=UPI003F637785
MALLAPVAGAQPAAPRAEAQETDALTDRARQLFQDGVKAAKAGKWADAHAAFLAAWSLKPHYQIASNLGVACLKVGKPRDAAEYLARYLREAPATKVNERQLAEASLQEARSKVAAVTVQVAPEGAEVIVDGATVGRAPLADPVFLDPGQHEVGAKLDGYTPQTRPIAATAGGTTTVVLDLSRKPEPAAVRPAPGPRVPPTPAASGDGGRTAVLVGGGIAAGAAVIAGVAFTLVANGKASDAEEKYRAPELAGGGDSSCWKPVEPGLEQPCDRLNELVHGEYLFRNVAMWSFIGGGAVALGTLGYYLLASPPSEPRDQVRASPFVTPGGGGVVVGGSF